MSKTENLFDQKSSLVIIKISKNVSIKVGHFVHITFIVNLVKVKSDFSLQITKFGNTKNKLKTANLNKTSMMQNNWTFPAV